MRVVREGGGWAWKLIELGGVLIGLSISGVLTFALDEPVWGIAALAATVVVIVGEGGFRLQRRECAAHREAVEKLERDRARAVAEREAAQSELAGSTAALVEEFVEDELLAIIDEGYGLEAGMSGPGFGAYKLWSEKAAEFVETVYGRAEGQRFRERADEPSRQISDELAVRLARLKALRDTPKPWRLQVDVRAVRRAVEQRQDRSDADRIVLAGQPNVPQAPAHGRSPFARSPLEAAVLESVVGAEGILRETRVRGIGGLPDAVAAWVDETEARLARVDAGDLLSELRGDALPDADDAEAHATYLNRQIARLSRAWRELRRDELTPVELLQERYDLGRDLHHNLPWLTGGADTTDALAEADKRVKRLVCQWAEQTWKVLRQHFRGDERAFYGPADAMPGLFSLACQEEVERLGSVENYLNAKLAFLADLLRGHER